MIRTEEEIEALKEIADIEDIVYMLRTMNLRAGSSMASWEKDLLIQRAKELHIKGMEEFLRFGDYSWIKRGRGQALNRRGQASLAKGIIPGSVALPTNHNIGGFVYRAGQKNKRNNSSKVNNKGEI